ncbi:MAG: zinc ribbon domain-containing protein [Actinomycetota bacterium]|nr:zinc ribbon domain-containing protein [Actinomycetota bacterium]
MPTYQYACTACSHEFEAVQSFSDNSLTTCPQCTKPIRKIYSAIGVVFKGSGFYKTDSVKKKTVSESTSPTPVTPAPTSAPTVD